MSTVLRTVIPRSLSLGGARGEIGIEKREEDMLAQIALDAHGVGIVPRALKNLKEDQVADKQPFQPRRSLELGGRRRLMAAQVGDPDRTVDENHGRSKCRPSRIWLSCPQYTLAFGSI